MLVLGRAVDLARHEHAAVDEQGRLPPLDHLEALRLQRAPAQGRQLEAVGARKGEPAARPDQRVHGHGQTAAAARETGQPSGMVEVAVTQDDALHLAEVDSEPVGVVGHAVGRDAGVEQQRGRGRPPAHRHQRRETVFGAQARRRRAALELRRLHATRTERCPGDRVS